jgi:hypothetical protein
MTPDELRTLAEAAMPGPWEDGDIEPGAVLHKGSVIFWVLSVGNADDSARDAAYIAAANPTAILALLDERDALRAALSRLESASWAFSTNRGGLWDYRPGGHDHPDAVEMAAAWGAASAALEER